MSTVEQNRKLIEQYPFLQPRNVWTDEIDEGYDYTYVLGVDSLPRGWINLFLQMCLDLKKQLIKDNYLEQFRFVQIKEKYNRMECYHNGCSEAVQRIIDKYTHMAQYVCTVCGQPAEWETQNYVASFCRQCWKNFGHYEPSESVNITTKYKLIIYSNGKKTYKTVSFKREWDRYLKSLDE